jgi:hemerythrin-like domain-containing protein
MPLDQDVTVPAATGGLVDRCDTREMITIHHVIRSEFALAAADVRASTPGDRHRSRAVGDHLALLNHFLHDHHTAEDVELWPLLVERVPTELEPLVHLMEEQHHRVDELLRQIGQVLPQWRETASEQQRDELAGLYQELFEGLHEHMAAEETRILPLAARSLSQDEWSRIGEAAKAGLPRGFLPLLVGMLAYYGDADGVERMRAAAPWVMRTLGVPVFQRVFRRRSRRVHGTATPPRR